jgi:hypothetical protein
VGAAEGGRADTDSVSQRSPAATRPLCEAL